MYYNNTKSEKKLLKSLVFIIILDLYKVKQVSQKKQNKTKTLEL